MLRKISLLMLLFALCLTPNLLAAEGHSKGDLRVTVEAAQLAVKGSDDVFFNVSMTNEGLTPYRILRWKTPFDGIDEDLFRVTRDGQHVSYLGRHIKRLAPTRADFLIIAPGQTLSATVELSKFYDFTVTGNYEVQYGVHGELPSKNSGVQSRGASLWVDGVPFAADNSTPPLRLAEAATTYVGCSNSQQSTIASAISNAESISQNSLNYLNNYSGSRSGSQRYTTWFGSKNINTYWSDVTGNFAAILSAFQNQNVTVNCGCNQNYYAYVYANQPYEIFVCNAFWAAPLTGTDSKAGTMVHEMSHFTVVAGTDDLAYGQNACKRLAKNSRRATNNADSHEYFAENTPSLP